MTNTAGREATSPVSPISPVSPVFEKHRNGIKRNASTKQLKLMNGPLYQQGHNNVNVVLVRRVRRKDDSAWKMLSRWMVENQIGMSSLSHPASLSIYLLYYSTRTAPSPSHNRSVTVFRRRYHETLFPLACHSPVLRHGSC